jgi:hypothetical protein
MASIGQWRFLWGEELRDAFRLGFQTNEVTTTALGDEHTPVDVAQTKKSVLRNSTTNRIQDISTQIEEPNWITTCTVDKIIHIKIQTSFDQVGCREYAHSCKKRLAGFGVISILFGIGAKQAAANPIAKIVLCVSVVASFILACINWRNYKGSNELKGKSDLLPAHSIACTRAQAYERGFLYVRERNLKLGSDAHYPCLLPCEVEFLFDEYVSQYSTSLLEQNPQSEEEKKAWLAAFKTNNPLSDDLFLYAKTGDQTERFVELRQDYKLLTETSRDDHKTRKDAALKTFNQNLETLGENRKKAIASFEKINEALKAQIDREENHENKMKICRIFNQDHEITKSIHTELNALEHAARCTYAETTSAIEAEQKLNLHDLFLDAKTLLLQMSYLLMDPNYQYTTSNNIAYAKQALIPIPLTQPMEEKDFLAEALVKFANNPQALEYLNTTTS